MAISDKLNPTNIKILTFGCFDILLIVGEEGLVVIFDSKNQQLKAILDEEREESQSKFDIKHQSPISLGSETSKEMYVIEDCTETLFLGLIREIKHRVITI